MGKKGSEKRTFFKVQRDILRSTGKAITPLIIFLILLDAAFYGLVSLSVFFVGTELKGQYEEIVLPDTLEGLSLTEAQVALAQSKAFLRAMIVGMVVVILLVILLWTAFKGLIWLLMLGQRPSKRFFARFLGFNVVWLTLWLFLIMGIQLLLDPVRGQPVLIVVFALFLAFTNTITAFFVTAPGLGAVKRGIATALGNPGHMLSGYVMLFLLWYGLSWVVAQGPAPRFTLPVLALLYFALARYYAAHLALALETKKKDI